MGSGILNKIFLCAMMLLLLAVPQANAQNTQDASQKNTKVGIFVFWLDDAYINLVTQSLQKHLAGKVELTIFDASQDQIIQLGQLATFLANGGEAVGMNLVDVKFGQDVLRQLNGTDIPIVFFNKQPSIRTLHEYPKASYVGSKAGQSGILQGEIIAEIWNNNKKYDRNSDGICNFVMLQGNLDNPEALARSKASVQRARALGVDMQQVGDTLLCDWDADCARDAIKAAFGVHGSEVDFIIANNDAMALGAVEALQEYGFNLVGGTASIPVVGIDAIADARSAIAKGVMHGTVIQDADAMGKAVAIMLLNAIKDKPFLDGLPYDWDEDKVSISIPYQPYKAE